MDHKDCPFCSIDPKRVVLAAWGYTVEGRRVLLHLMAGSKEDAETVSRAIGSAPFGRW